MDAARVEIERLPAGRRARAEYLVSKVEEGMRTADRTGNIFPLCTSLQNFGKYLNARPQLATEASPERRRKGKKDKKKKKTKKHAGHPLKPATNSRSRLSCMEEFTHFENVEYGDKYLEEDEAPLKIVFGDDYKENDDEILLFFFERL